MQDCGNSIGNALESPQSKLSVCTQSGVVIAPFSTTQYCIQQCSDIDLGPSAVLDLIKKYSSPNTAFWPWFWIHKIPNTYTSPSWASYEVSVLSILDGNGQPYNGMGLYYHIHIVLFQVHANDRDVGDTVRYEIVSDTAGNAAMQFFWINPDSGILVATRILTEAPLSRFTVSA